MPIRTKAIVLSRDGGIYISKIKDIKRIAKEVDSRLELTGRLREDLSRCKKVFLTADLYLFSWKEAKGSTGKTQFIAQLQRALKTARAEVISNMVMDKVGKYLEEGREIAPIRPKRMVGSRIAARLRRMTDVDEL